jgi:hypothetical protein
MSFEQYYKGIYLRAHRKKGTRIAHFIGVLFTIAWFIASIAVNNLFMFSLTPFVVYPLAWTSHWLIEKNKPLAWSNIWLAKASDFRMCWEMLTGKLDWGE